MPKFYGTFMQKQATRNHYVEIESAHIDLARYAMFAHFGDRFMTIYPEHSFLNQIAEFGLKKMIGIQVIDHGHGNIEYREMT